MLLQSFFFVSFPVPRHKSSSFGQIMYIEERGGCRVSVEDATQGKGMQYVISLFRAAYCCCCALL